LGCSQAEEFSQSVEFVCDMNQLRELKLRDLERQAFPATETIP
jgi:hypothetical protein